ncbi:cation diffusion facilitator family transporter [Candidatus Woesearchaeota archaeon]|nr:cation diffusion facilitator family transporter [Candidatus Woesearchaeota archaeon]
MEEKEKISLIAIISNIFLSIFKIAVGILSKSSAVIAEGIHSGMDIITSAISYGGIRAAKKPVDKKHPYGHYKAEVFAGLLITLVLLGTSVWIIYGAITNFFTVKELFITPLTLGVMGFSAVINEIMARLKIKFGKKYESMALLADGKHSRIDVLASLSVFIGLFLTRYWIHLDSIIALLIGVYILVESISLGKKTTDSLLDVSADEEVENQIKDIIKREKIELVNLKTQKLGSAVFAELKIKLDPKLKVDQASSITKDLEKKVQEEVAPVEYIVIQIESHEIREESFKGAFGVRTEWKGRMGGRALGPGGKCTCLKCGKIIPHKAGTPCYKIKCPECGSFMTRKATGGNQNARKRKRRKR